MTATQTDLRGTVRGPSPDVPGVWIIDLDEPWCGSKRTYLSTLTMAPAVRQPGACCRIVHHAPNLQWPCGWWTAEEVDR